MLAALPVLSFGATVTVTNSNVYAYENATVHGYIFDNGHDYITSGDVDVSSGLNTSVFLGYDDIANTFYVEGGTLKSTGGYLGYNTGSQGTMTLYGTGASWDSAGYNVFLGNYGEGTLNVENGASFSANRLYLGYGADASGSFTVDDSTTTLSDYVSVGYNGTGTLRVLGTAQFSSKGANISNTSTSTATVQVSGATATWTNTGAFYIGNGGSATMRVENGGTATATGAILVRNGSTLVVTSGGSIVGNLGFRVGGDASNGTATISGGASVRCVYGTVLASGSYSALVTVSGAGSVWNSTTSLVIGDSYSDTTNNILVIDDLGLVKVGTNGLTINHTATKDNSIRLGDGFLALLGDKTSSLASWLTAGAFYIWDAATSTWAVAEEGDIEAVYYTDAALAKLATSSGAFAGYEDLGGYTIFTSTAVPEPSTYALLGGLAALLVAIRRKRMAGGE